MKILENCITLSCSVQVYIPSTINVSQPSENDSWINRALDLFSEEFGGATTTNGFGAWKAEDGQRVKERITLVFSYATQIQLANSIDKIYQFCQDMKKALCQEAISLEVNNKLYFIK